VNFGQKSKLLQSMKEDSLYPNSNYFQYMQSKAMRLVHGTNTAEYAGA